MVALLLVLMMLLALAPEAVEVVLIELDLFDERVLPREERVELVDLAVAHISVSVRGDLERLLRVERRSEGESASISIASSGAGGGRRGGEAVISAALRVRGGSVPDGEEADWPVVDMAMLGLEWVGSNG